MSVGLAECVVLADRHHGLSEGIRGLLETRFRVVVMVADEASLVASAARLEPAVAVVQLSLSQGDHLGWLRRLRERCPDVKVIVLSAHGEPSVSRAARRAGADGYVASSAIGSELLDAVDTVLAGRKYPPDPGFPEPENPREGRPS